MPFDPTEIIRRQMVAKANFKPGSREDLQLQHGQVWDTQEMQRDYDAIGFMAPFIVVRRKSDGVKGSLTFQSNPRFYFSFKPH